MSPGEKIPIITVLWYTKRNNELDGIDKASPFRWGFINARPVRKSIVKYAKKKVKLHLDMDCIIVYNDTKQIAATYYIISCILQLFY